MANETVEVYGRRGNVIGMAEIIYSLCHCPVGLILPASTVRAILHDSDLFRADEVERWDETARTPFRADVNRWILDTAREDGLAYKAAGRYAEPLEMSADSGDYEPFKWARRGWILEQDDSKARKERTGAYARAEIVRIYLVLYRLKDRNENYHITDFGNLENGGDENQIERIIGHRAHNDPYDLRDRYLVGIFIRGNVG